MKKRKERETAGWAYNARSAVSGFFYNISVKIHEHLPHKKNTALGVRKRNNMIFYCLLMIFPVAQFCVFWIGVNTNSILLAFRSYDALTGIYTWVGFENLSNAFYDLVHDPVMLTAAGNSLLAYFWGLVAGVSLGILFSYYIYKKRALHGIFKVLLFLPSVISSMAMSIMFNYVVERAVPEIVAWITNSEVGDGLISNPDSAFTTILIYGIWFGFGGNVLMYVGAMSGISDSVVEAAQLDGAGPAREFFSITLPSIWPTISTFLIVGVAGIFTNQMSLYNFFGGSADSNLYTFGYFLYKETVSATTSRYPYLSSMGILMTCVAAPLTLGIRKLLDKLGPSVN